MFKVVAEGKSAAVRAVAGAGKTSTLLEAATRALEADQTRRFLVLTYNRRLCSATAARLGGRSACVCAMTYHSAAARLFDVPVNGGSYDACIDLACKCPALAPRITPFDTLFVDEAQDLNPLFLRFVLHLIQVSKVRAVVLAGDERQTLYGYKDGDAKSTAEILLDPARFFPAQVGRFASLCLSVSFRVPPRIADFVNAELWQAGAQRIDSLDPRGERPGSVRLLECTPSLFAAAEAIAKHIAQTASGSTAVLGHSDNAKTPLREIGNRLRALGVVVAAPDQDQDQEGQEAARDGACRPVTVTVGTFHSTKGLEWDTVYVVGFDCYYHRATKAFEPHAMDPLYVACTRARDKLILVKCSRHGLPFQVRASAFGKFRTPQNNRQPAVGARSRPALVTGAIPWSIIGEGRVASMLALSDAAVPLNTACSAALPCKQCSHDAPRCLDAMSLTSSLPVAACDELLAWFGPFAVSLPTETLSAPSSSPFPLAGRPEDAPLLDPCAAALLNRGSRLVVDELLATAHRGAAQKRSSSLAALRLVRELWPAPRQHTLEPTSAPWWSGVPPERLGATLVAWDAVARDSTELVCRASQGSVSCKQIADEAIATARREAELVCAIEAKRSVAVAAPTATEAVVEWGVRVEANLPATALVYPCCARTGPATVTGVVDALSETAAYCFVFQRPGDRALALACVLALAANRPVACVVDVRTGEAWEARNPSARRPALADAVLAQAARASLGCTDPFAAKRQQMIDAEQGARLKLAHAEERQRSRVLHDANAKSAQKRARE